VENQTFSNDAFRQKFVDNTVPQVLQLGLTVPDPDLNSMKKQDITSLVKLIGTNFLT
jgi:1,2-phenylacetyl-CoA epoxidase catalytic subunit